MLVRRLDQEVDKLRSWRHDVVAPGIMAIERSQADNNRAIVALTQNIQKITETLAPIAALVPLFAEHRSDDNRQFIAINTTMRNMDDKLDGNRDVLMERIASAREEGNKGHAKVIVWVAGIVGAGMTALIGAMWALLSPVLSLHLPH